MKGFVFYSVRFDLFAYVFMQTVKSFCQLLILGKGFISVFCNQGLTNPMARRSLIGVELASEPYPAESKLCVQQITFEYPMLNKN